jgi:glycosyltransferase involved in cell wall biosynthesis
VKIILFANTDWYLYNFRLPLARVLREEGHEVLLISPPGQYGQRLLEEGLRWEALSLSRRGANPLAEAAAILRLRRLYRREQPDLVHHFTIKPVLWGSLAARLAGVKKVVNAITGLGYVFTTRSTFTLIARLLVRWLYRLCLRDSRVIFQNQHDLDFFERERLVSPGQAALIRGSGVDIQRYQPAPLPAGLPVVVLPARMLWDKGVAEFVEAAHIINADGVKARFALVGLPDEGNPSAILPVRIEEWVRLGLVEHWGWRDDMAAVYHAASLVCLPSYGEGLAKSLIEAASCGRALVASDIPGCREVVQNDVNGLLVPPRDARALADALRTLLDDRTRLEEMGRSSREIAVRHFAVEMVNRDTIKEYNKV